MLYEVTAAKLGKFLVSAKDADEARAKVVRAVSTDFAWDDDIIIVDVTREEEPA